MKTTNSNETRPHGLVNQIPAVKSTPDFKDDLKRANKDEAEFRLSYDLEEPTDWSHDALIGNIKIELKFDHQIAKYNNLFVEVISSEEQMSDGGPIRAVKDGVQLYVYVSKEMNKVWVFDPAVLVEEANDWGKYKDLKRVYNKDKNTGRTWVTLGYAISVKRLQPLALGVFDENSPELTSFFKEVASNV